MIEYLDENLGVVKVLNVTEARANFAAVLGDGSSHYIITKNNKPLRVIINHQDYLTLKQAVEAKTGIVSSSPLGLPVKKELLFQKKGESRVRGLIEASLSSLPKPAPAVPAATHEAPVIQDPALARKAAIAEALKRIEANNAAIKAASVPPSADTQEEGLAAEHQEADYFSQEEAPTITEPGEHDSESIEVVTSDESTVQEDPAPPTAAAREGAEIQNIMRQFIQDDKKTKPNTTAQADMTPQQLEYYKKYKKLYESFADKDAESEAPEPQQDSVPRVAETVKRPEPSLTKKTAALKESEAAVNYWDQNEDEESTREQRPRSTEGGLPSLKELLKELEEERLSDEGPESKGNHDIDDLINRITNDY